MYARTARLSVALLVAAPLAAMLHAQGVEYAAGTTRYRISTTTKGSQTGPGGANTPFEVGVQEQITLNLMKHAKDTVMATFTVDSIAVKSSGPVPDVSKLIGAQWVSLVSPNGKFYSTKSSVSVDPQLGQVLESLKTFLPAYRGSLAQGATWTDTTSGKVSQQGMDLDRTSISTFKVAGDTTIGGQKALRVERVTTVKAAGSGTMQGTPIMMETSGTSNGAFFLAPKGVYLGGSSTDDVSVKITVLAQNMELNIKQVAQNKIETIK